MEVTISGIKPTDSGLRIGLVIRQGKGGPVRFATTDLFVEDLDDQDCQHLAHLLNTRRNHWLEIWEPPLF